jgi:hypothetical protein
MKKIILSVAAIFAVSTLSTAAFAAFDLSPGTIYSVGTLTPATYKTSPKVTIRVSGTQGTTATEWGAVSGHLSALNKDKGMHYYTNNSDPGMWSMRKPTTEVTSYDPSATAAPDNFVVEK